MPISILYVLLASVRVIRLLLSWQLPARLLRLLLLLTLSGVVVRRCLI